MRANCGKTMRVKGVKTMKARKKETAREPKGLNASPPMPEELIKKLDGYFAGMMSILENYAVRLHAQDRRRLNGVRKPTLGFVSDAYRSAELFPNLLPYYCPIEKFREDFKYFNNFQMLLGLCKTAQEMLWNITLKAADAAYEDALMFYAQVREAKIKGIDAHENLYNNLFQFFKKSKRDGAEPAQKEVMSDVNALLRGKKDGEVIVRNVRPKVAKGRREVADEVIKED
jgi:hypothetical protein